MLVVSENKLRLFGTTQQLLDCRRPFPPIDDVLMHPNVIYKPQDSEKHPRITKELRCQSPGSACAFRDFPDCRHNGCVKGREVAIPSPIGIDLESPHVESCFQSIPHLRLIHRIPPSGSLLERLVSRQPAIMDPLPAQKKCDLSVAYSKPIDLVLGEGVSNRHGPRPSRLRVHFEGYYPFVTNTVRRINALESGV
jgi:hypothetical protein